jgi:hypothetical protein
MSVVAVVLAAPASAQTGLTYRYRGDTGAGQVWVQGENARLQIDLNSRPTFGPVEIWKDRGRQRLVLNPEQRTYHDETARRAKAGVPDVTNPMLTVARPFRVQSVGALRFETTPSRRSQTIGEYTCYPMQLDFSYTLTISLENTPGTFPAHIEGVEEFCIIDSAAPVRLPFHHAMEFTSSHPEVDEPIAARLAELKGIPIARRLKVTRRIEGGETTSGTSTLFLSDIKQVNIPADRFTVPAGYRLMEPLIAAPSGR